MKTKEEIARCTPSALHWRGRAIPVVYEAQLGGSIVAWRCGYRFPADIYGRFRRIWASGRDTAGADGVVITRSDPLHAAATLAAEQRKPDARGWMPQPQFTERAIIVCGVSLPVRYLPRPDGLAVMAVRGGEYGASAGTEKSLPDDPVELPPEFDFLDGHRETQSVFVFRPAEQAGLQAAAVLPRIEQARRLAEEHRLARMEQAAKRIAGDRLAEIEERRRARVIAEQVTDCMGGREQQSGAATLTLYTDGKVSCTVTLPVESLPRVLGMLPSSGGWMPEVAQRERQTLDFSNPVKTLAQT